MRVTAARADGSSATVRFAEGCVTVSGAGRLEAEYEAGFRRTISVADDALGFVFQGYRYRVPVRGKVRRTEKGFRIDGGEIGFDLTALR